MALNENRLDVAERLLKPHLKEDPFDAAAKARRAPYKVADLALAELWLDQVDEDVVDLWRRDNRRTPEWDPTRIVEPWDTVAEEIEL